LTVPVTRTSYRASGYQHPESHLSGITAARHKEIIVRLGAQEVDAYEDGRLLRTLVASTGLPKRRLCRACFDGQYPIPVPPRAAEQMRLIAQEGDDDDD